MKKIMALMAVLCLLMAAPLLHAQTAVRISDKAYDLEVRSVYVQTSLNGKYRVLKYDASSGVVGKTNEVTLEYDFEEMDSECVGRYEEDAPVALVYVHGFDSSIAALEEDKVVLTVNGLPLDAEEQTDVRDYIGWEDVRKNGSRSAVFPVMLTKEGGVHHFTVRVQTLQQNTVVTETAVITVKLINTHEYKDEKQAHIVDIKGDGVEAYIVGDKIYLDHPPGSTGSRVTLCFADENGKTFDRIAWAQETLCKAEGEQAALYLEEEIKLDEDSCATYLLDSGCEQNRTTAVRFVLDTKDALYLTKAYGITERFDIAAQDPKGIFFAEPQKVLLVGQVWQPTVLGVCTESPVQSDLHGTLTLKAGEHTDAQVIDVSDGRNVIGVKEGVAYITAQYVQYGKIYDAAGMKIIVRKDAQEHYRVTCRKLNVRSAPTVDSARIAQLMRGETVTVESIENGWAKLSGGGYVCMDYLEMMED